MSSHARNRQLSLKEAGMVAETIVSDPNYRKALNAPYLSEDESELSPVEVDTLHAQQAAAAFVIGETIKVTGVRATPEIQSWEAGRQAVTALLGNQALGSFEDYFLGPDSIPAIDAVKAELLPNGRPEIVKINTRIVGLSNNVNAPLDFLDTALGVIDRQKRIGRDKVGPENYATTLKLFSDKYASIEHDTEEMADDALTLPDLTDIKGLVDEALKGFFQVAARDAPNYVEMTNIYATIRALPKGAIDPKFTHDILMHTAHTMNHLESRAVRVLFGALPKMDTSEYPLETSAIVNMLLQRETQFDTTYSLRMTVRAIDSLEKNSQTDAALRAFFDMATGFDQPLDLEGIDEVMDRLKHIVKDVTEDPEISVRAKEFTRKCMVRTNQLTQQMLTSGTLTQAQGNQLQETYGRIKANYQAI